MDTIGSIYTLKSGRIVGGKGQLRGQGEAEVFLPKYNSILTLSLRKTIPLQIPVRPKYRITRLIYSRKDEIFTWKFLF